MLEPPNILMRSAAVVARVMREALLQSMVKSE
jgi:hypothetical protein